MRFRRRRGTLMPWRFDQLADYNARVSKGIVHTPEYTERMVGLQADFNEWQRQSWLRAGAVEQPDGTLILRDGSE
jgi:hypothetical protein